MNLPDLVTWLKQRTALSILTQEVLQYLAPKLEERILPANQRLVLANTPPAGLYILRSGRIESNPEDWQAVGLLPGAVINLQALLLNTPVEQTLITLNQCQFWFVSASEFRALVEHYPEITQAFSQQLAEEVEELSAQLAYEQERQTILRPYLVSKAKRGIIGKSRYGVRLRSQVKQAAENRESVIIFGEPGLEKDNIAALIHFSSPYRREAMIKVDCSKLQARGAELFGRAGGKPGLIEALGQGTLLLNNIQELSPELIREIANLLRTNTYTPVNRSQPVVAHGGDPQDRATSEHTDVAAAKVSTSQARIIMIAERKLPEIDSVAGQLIKVPPLRVRKADIGDIVNYYISIISRAKCINKNRITPEALRRLQAYDFPNNLKELFNLVERAIVQLEGCSELTEEIIWPSQSKKKKFRLNLLNAYPGLRRFLRSPWWPDRINYGFTLTAFAIIVVILFIGPQNRQENFALNLFWAWWWPLVLISFPFVGRLWCAVCPFMIYGEVTQKVSLWLFPRKLKRWPREQAQTWGGWFLFGLFFLILLWEELWDLENTAYLSACLLLLITAGAMICSAIFERRFWCRYLCPIGGMNGMFAKLSITELRAQQGICSAECSTYQCYKGGPEKGEGMETDGCPLYSHPAQLEDNRDCVLCMTCLKACPHRSVEVNLRPPGIELWTTHVPRSYEVALLFLLLGAVFLHRLPELQENLGLGWDLSQFWTHGLLSVTVLILPAIVPLLAQGIMVGFYQLKETRKPSSFVKLAYGYLPLVLAGNLAHYWRLGLGEGGRILPVMFATFGLSGEGLPVLVAHPAVIAFLQGTTLIAGVLLSLFLTQKIGRQPFTLLLPHHVSTLVLGISLWWIIVG
ncbi:sigma 54-interacting transcriptional regulator [Moorena sp. SIO4G3]|uniref:sigma 54-interacting transcriptional regulator n=1 Tax=Moorena sp. SIO4G3 TaxID=2607821 RepID=UPI001429CC1F|nr:sigma 54-interacting transcriptional regulator [Moorena sp. SIO4G3]NEO81197.1 cyclic nucleotide-binding domain-containing protein [Moorena sp. SIO4G3]